MNTQIYRIGYCDGTKADVVQRQEENGEWLCLHYDSVFQDSVQVALFKNAVKEQETTD